MKKLLTLLLAVCLLTTLVLPATAASTTRNVDLCSLAKGALDELGKYNSTEVGQPFNVKTMIGYTFGVLTKQGKLSAEFVEDATGRYEWYAFRAADLEAKMLSFFADGQKAINEMQSMSIKDYTFEYGGKVADADLKVYQAGHYYFNNYNLDRTSKGTLPSGQELWVKSNTGFVAVADIHNYQPLYTINGYKAAGNYRYDLYATHNDGSIVKFVIEWGGSSIKFVSTAAAASLPAGLTTPGTKADLPLTTTAKPTTTTTTKPTTTTTTKPTAGNNGGGTTTTTTAVPDGGNGEVTPAPTDNGTTTTTTKAKDNVSGDVNTDGAVEGTTEQGGEEPGGDSSLYIIIAVVVGVVVLAFVAVIILVTVKMKKKK